MKRSRRCLVLNSGRFRSFRNEGSRCRLLLEFLLKEIDYDAQSNLGSVVPNLLVQLPSLSIEVQVIPLLRDIDFSTGKCILSPDLVVPAQPEMVSTLQQCQDLPRTLSTCNVKFYTHFLDVY